MPKPPAMREWARLGSLLLILAMLGIGACRGNGARPLPDSAFKVSFGEPEVPRQMATGAQITVDVRVRNASDSRWPSEPDARGRNAVHLAYHWTTEQDDLVIYDGMRTALPRDVGPGDTVTLKTLVQAPERAGKYLLEMTLVQEGVAWFPDKGGAKISMPVTVIEAMALGREKQRHTSFEPKPPARLADGRRSADGAPRVQQATSEPPSPNSAPAGELTPSRRDFWSVQVASLSRQNGSEDLARTLRSKGYDAYVASANIKGRDLFQVHVGRLSTRMEAEKLKQLLKDAENLDQVFIVYKS